MKVTQDKKQPVQMESQVYETPDDIVHGSGSRVNTSRQPNLCTSEGAGTFSDLSVSGGEQLAVQR